MRYPAQVEPTVKRTQVVIAFAVFSTLVLGIVTAPASSLAGGNCMAKLVGSSAIAPGFDCNVKSFAGGVTTVTEECWTFASGGHSQYFDIYTETGITELPQYGCACDTTGSYNSPRFDSSSDQFECADEMGGQLQGKVKGKKITGQSSDAEGNAAIFTCVPNTGCG